MLSKLKTNAPYFKYAVSHTTRRPRPNETNGVEYFFISRQKFEKMIENSEFVEYAEVKNIFVYVFCLFENF